LTYLAKRASLWKFLPQDFTLFELFLNEFAR
jgi:hypothetical protein